MQTKPPKERPFLRTWFGNRFYRLSSRLFEVKIPQDVGDFRLMDRVVVEALFNLRENQRFMKGILPGSAFSVTIEFDVADREHGTSSFNLWKLLSFAVDGITSFTTVPLRLWFCISASSCQSFRLHKQACLQCSRVFR